MILLFKNTSVSHLTSLYLSNKTCTQSENSLSPTLLIQHDSTAEDQAAAVRHTLDAVRGQGAPVLAILPGAETGVELAEM